MARPKSAGGVARWHTLPRLLLRCLIGKSSPSLQSKSLSEAAHGEMERRGLPTLSAGRRAKKVVTGPNSQRSRPWSLDQPQSIPPIQRTRFVRRWRWWFVMDGSPTRCREGPSELWLQQSEGPHGQGFSRSHEGHSSTCSHQGKRLLRYGIILPIAMYHGIILPIAMYHVWFQRKWNKKRHIVLPIAMNRKEQAKQFHRRKENREVRDAGTKSRSRHINIIIQTLRSNPALRNLPDKWGGPLPFPLAGLLVWGGLLFIEARGVPRKTGRKFLHYSYSYILIIFITYSHYGEIFLPSEMQCYSEIVTLPQRRKNIMRFCPPSKTLIIYNLYSLVSKP